MTDGLVLVHGGMHGSWGWDPLVSLLDLPCVAVDLPGRGSRPADLTTVTLEDCVAAVLDAADAAGFDRFALVGHSLGGVTLTETGHRHPDRVSHLVYVGAIVPAIGSSASDILVGSDLAEMPVMVEETARAMFGNDLDDEQWAHHFAGLVPDAATIMNAKVTGHPAGIPITYVGMTRDVPIPPALAEQMIANLGRAVDVRTIDAGHTVMVSKPRELADIVNEVTAA